MVKSILKLMTENVKYWPKSEIDCAHIAYTERIKNPVEQQRKDRNYSFIIELEGQRSWSSDILRCK